MKKITTISDRPVFVVDASVAAKWHLQDEQDFAVARRILHDYREHRIRLIAPSHIRYEVASAIRKAWRVRRLTLDEARRALEDFLSWRIPTVDSDSLILAALEYSANFGCSYYDGLYLALAESTTCPVIYADARLRNAIAGRFPLALWIDDYRPVAEP